MGRWERRAWPFESSDPLALPEAYADARLYADAVPVLVRGSVAAHLVTRHQLVSDLLHHPALSAEPGRDAYPAPSSRSLETKRGQQAFVRLDPPEHTRYRRAVLPALSKTTAARLGDLVTAIAHRCVEDTLRDGVTDVVTTLAAPLPLQTSHWLGVPLDEAEELVRPADTWASLTEGTTPPEQLQAWSTTTSRADCPRRRDAAGRSPPRR